MDLASTMKQRDGKLELQVRTGWLRGMLVMGFGAGGGIAAGWGLLELVSHDPKEGFALLKVWGPWAIVVVFAMFVVWKLSAELISLARVMMNAWVSTSERQAVSSEVQATALTKLAEQGGRQGEEVKRLAVYAAREFPTVYERMDRQDTMLQSNHDATMELHGLVRSLADRIDAASRARGGDQ